MTDLPVHPFADRFPMMSDDEISDLAADIKAHGLIHPIMLDRAGKMLIDGRNRLRACKVAGVEPRFERLNGQDPYAFMVSANIERRNLSVGQRAMLYAIAYPEPEKGGRGKKTFGDRRVLTWERISVARALLKAGAPDLVERVVAGDQSLDAAYDEARKRQGYEKSLAARMRDLDKARPDLAECVRTGEMSIDDALAAVRRAADELKQQRWAFTVNLIETINTLDRDPESVGEIAGLFDPAVEDQKGSPKITVERLNRVVAFVNALAACWEGE